MTNQKFEYRMTPDGEIIAIPSGSCPPGDSIYIGQGEEEFPEQVGEEEQYSLLTKAVNYDKSLHF